MFGFVRSRKPIFSKNNNDNDKTALLLLSVLKITKKKETKQGSSFEKGLELFTAFPSVELALYDFEQDLRVYALMFWTRKSRERFAATLMTENCI